MEVIDLSDEYVPAYCMCLEEWSDEMKESGTLKREWYDKKKNQGLRVKLARNEKGEAVGMIHYVPIENAPAIGKNLYYIYCVWVHGYRQGAGDQRKKGIGKSLLHAAEEDARALGADGIAAWGITLPFFMRSRWFKKHGYARADKEGMTELVWKPFNDRAEKPALVRMKKKPAAGTDKTQVTCFRNGWCPAQNIACERMKRAAGEFGDRVGYAEINTDDKANFDEWGISDAVFINDRRINTGPPPSYERLRGILRKSAGR